LDATGQAIAEIDDDTVRAAAPGDSVATLSRWREVEVELAAPDERLLHRLGKHLRRAGARPADHASKLARALPGPATGGSDRGRPPRAGDVVGHYIAEQRRVLLAGDIALRRGDDTAIHKTRVAARRLRSTLRVFKPFFEPGPSAALDRELRWYAGLLGAVRDRQVLRERLDAMVADVDDSLLLGPVRARIDSELRQEQAENWHRLTDAMTGTRYLALLADLDRWVDDPPRTPAAGRPGRAVAKRVRRAKQTVRRRLRRASATGDVALLHRARKAAKRARYAAEAAEPVLGAHAAAHLAKQHRNLQDLLGEHQDSLVSAPLLRRLGASAGSTPGENGFAFGILHEREQANARQARAKVRAIVKHHRRHNRHR
jgi:CHAD domain-containing protein